MDAADRARLVRLAAHPFRLRRRRDGAGDVPAVHAVRPVRRRARRPARRAPHGDRDAGRPARHRHRARVDRDRRDRAAVDALRDRLRQRDGARPRRPVPPAAHVPHGRARGPAERDRAQLEPLQRVADPRPCRRRRASRLRRRRRVLPRQCDQLPRGAAQPVRDAHARLLPAGEVRAAGDLARHARGTRVRAAPAQDARHPRIDRRAQHVRVQLQRDAAGARGPDAAHERAGVRDPVGDVRRRRTRRRACRRVASAGPRCGCC